jgi:hypothetical protein
VNINYSINIQPILTNGNSGANGKYLFLNNSIRIDSINFDITNNVQTLYLKSQGTDINYPNKLFIDEFFIPHDIFEPKQIATLNMHVSDTDAFSDPICDLIREGDIVRIYRNLSNSTELEQIFVGIIETIEISYDTGGMRFSINIGSLLNILARSPLAQTESELKYEGTILTALTSQQFVFGDLLNYLLQETSINETVTKIRYFGGITNQIQEVIAAGKTDENNITSSNGSAINANSYVLALTPPTGYKFDCIAQILYPFQRIFYIAPNGDFIITPLQTYFNNIENWELNLKNATPEQIPILKIMSKKNSTVIKNRSYCTLNDIFRQYISSGITGAPANQSLAPYSVAIPSQQYFPRLYDFVISGEALQTDFVSQSVNADDLIQNSGILNMARNLSKGITGLKSILSVDNSNTYITTADSNKSEIKFITSLFSARNLAENITQDLLVDVIIPTVNTYHPILNRLRYAPLNQMVKIPHVNNNNFDGLQQLFCYGVTYNWSSAGSITTLRLCKPFVYTALWADQLKEI